MNCLIVIPSLTRAGAETQAVDLANGLSAEGHSVHLCSFERQLDQRERLSDEVRFHHLQRSGKYDFALIGKVAAVMDRERIDVVQGVLQFATLIAWLAARRSKSRPPVIAAVHTTINRDLKHELFDRLLYRRLLRRLPAIVFVCDYQREHWMRKYPELSPKSFVVHNGVVPERFRYQEFSASGRQLRAELDIPEGAFVFSCIAAFRPEKGHELLIEAMSRIEGETCLVLAGDGELRPAIEERAAAAGLKGRTRFLGNIPDTRPLIAASNATVLASTAVETFSMAMLESMAMGVPMIAPRIGGLPEAIIDGDTGLLFPIADTSALTHCMQSLVEGPAEAVRMGRSAEIKVTGEFNLARMVAGSEQVMNRVLRPAGQGDDGTSI